MIQRNYFLKTIFSFFCFSCFLCYNDGANILKKAAPLANSDADKYAAEKEKADGRFKEALDYLEEAAKISPENENVKKMLPQVKAVMK